MYGKSNSGGKIIVCAGRLIKPRGHRVSLLLDLVRVRIVEGVGGTFSISLNNGAPCELRYEK